MSKNPLANKKARPYLEDYPFTEKNIGVVFYISEKNYQTVYHPQICLAEIHSDGVLFRTNDPENEFRYKETYRETFEEATELVNQYRQKIPKP